MINYANRGQGLEDEIELTNQEYLRHGLALVQKVPTPIKQISPIKRGKFTAVYEKKSTVDYIGIYNGISLAFDAKETQVETRFDLSNVKEHQYLHLTSWHCNKGLGFLVVRFATLGETYYLPYEVLDEYWQGMLTGGRKSIPYDVIAKPEYEIKQGKGMALVDYLSVIKEGRSRE